MNWHLRPMTAFDLETTGVDVEADRIVSASRWVIRPAEGFKRHCGWLVNPGVPIPEEASAIHGITTEHAREKGQNARSAVREIAGDLVHWSAEQHVVVAFNAAYDITLLHRECVRHGHDDLAEQVAALRPVVDPFVIDKYTEPFRKGSRRLTAVTAHYGGELSEDDAHGSAADALAAARLAYRLAAKWPALARRDPDELHDMQREWRAEQAASLQRYLRRKDNKAAVVRPEWPLLPVPQPIQEEIPA